MGNAWNRVRRASQTTAGASRRAGRSVAYAGRRIGQGTRSLGQATRRLTHAQGAGRTGLGRLIELTSAHSAGDALVTVALAGALFFKLPVGQARGQVALYLLITMVPFTVVAPFVGPVLDRFRSGRRYVMAGTLFARGLLCWGMAAAIRPSDALTLFPAALAVLVLSKAYNVSRAAIMPSVLPADITLVAANARVALFALVSAGAAAGVATGLTAWLGADWVLRATTALFLVAGVAAVRLPRHVDSPDLESDLAPDPEPGADAEPSPHTAPATGTPGGPHPGPTGGDRGIDQGTGQGISQGDKVRSRTRWRELVQVGPIVGEAMRANAAIRVQAGFLVFFLLFLVQDGNIPGLAPHITLGLLAVAAGGGGFLGAAVASWTRSRSPQIIVLGTLALATVATIVTTVYFTLWTAVVVALVAAFAQGLGKLALDAIVQREIAEEVRSSTFGVTEALLQIAWVFGGLVGLVMSLSAHGPAGLAVVSAGLAVTFVWLLIRRRTRLAAAARRAPEGGGTPPDAPDDETAPSQGTAWTPHVDSDVTPADSADPDVTPVVPHEPLRPRRDDTKPLTNPY
ncbi:MFS transporter [Microtetraspora sp. NBRC 16547]|uniref:MFS transporter n=1 Tax=Microtetraspora sp. NBRC 16547 TaxID=3030993 RepID=UPI0024A42FBB|nr:MFS transporter [Microtetraspora sp. NBRC 16547]GLW97461.1 MFS transporter [Microtetraspora sp. NBRC 16547]